MHLTALLALLCLSPVTITSTDFPLQAGCYKKTDFILAPGDSVLVTASCLRMVGSSCGMLHPLGDVFKNRGDNVGRLALLDWRGNELSSAYELHHPTLAYYTPEGGAFGVSIENNSGHRTNLYSLSVVRTPTRKEWREFDGAFRADTSYETTWVKEQRQRLVRTDTRVDTVWRTKHDRVLVGVDTSSVAVMNESKHIKAGNRDVVFFEVPKNTKAWAFWVGTSEAYSALVQTFGKTAGLAGALSGNPLAAFALGLIGDLATNPKSDQDIRYALSQQKGGAYVPTGHGGRIKESYYRLTSGVGSAFRLELDNTYSRFNAKDVRVQVTAALVDERYETVTSQVPEVKISQNPVYEHHEVDVPVVRSSAKPVLPWQN